MSIFLQPPWLPYLKTFLPTCTQKCADFSIGMTRSDILDNFNFDLKALAKQMKEL